MKKLTPKDFQYKPLEDAWSIYRKNLEFPPGVNRDRIRRQYLWMVPYSLRYELMAAWDLSGGAIELDPKSGVCKVFGIRVRFVIGDNSDDPMTLVRIV